MLNLNSVTSIQMISKIYLNSRWMDFSSCWSIHNIFWQRFHQSVLVLGLSLLFCCHQCLGSSFSSNLLLMWLDKTHRCIDPLDVGLPIVPLGHFWSLFMVCSMTWSGGSIVNFSFVARRETFAIVGVNFESFVDYISSNWNFSHN